MNPEFSVTRLTVFQRRAAVLIIALICLVGFYLRFETLTQRPIWYDETLTAAIAVDSDSIIDVWQASTEDGGEHPLLYYLLAYISLHSPLGSIDDPMGTRFPAFLAGCLSLPLIALLGWRLGGPAVGITASFLFATSIYQVNYAQDARPYSLLVLLALCSALSLRWLLSSKSPTLPLIGFVVVGMAALYTHHTALLFHAALVLGVFGLCCLLTFRPDLEQRVGVGTRTIFVRTALAYLLIALAFAPQWTNLSGYLGSANLDPRHTLTLSLRVFNQLAERWTFGWPLSALFLLFAAVGLLRTAKIPDQASLLIPWLLVPFAVFGSVPFIKFFDIRFVAVAYPAFVLLAALGADSVLRAACTGISRWFNLAPETGKLFSGLSLTLLLGLCMLATIPNYLDFRALRNRCDNFFHEPELLTEFNQICARQLILNSLNPDQSFLLSPVATTQ